MPNLLITYALHYIAILTLNISVCYKLQLGYDLFILVAYVSLTLVASAATLTYLLALTALSFLLNNK